MYLVGGGVLCYMSYRILAPQSGIESWPPALRAQSLSHWTNREAPP